MNKTRKRTGLIVVIATMLVFSLFFATGCQSKGKTLYLYNWTYYTPDSVIEKFEKEFGVKVVLDYFDSNEAMFAKLKAGGSGYDIVFPSQDYTSIMMTLGIAEKLDKAKLPNLKYIRPQALEKATYDPTMDFSVPYYMGASGIAVNKTKAPADYARDWSIFADTRMDGRMSMLDDLREVLGDALAHLGYSVNTTDDAELAKAQKLINEQWKPNLVKFDAEGSPRASQVASSGLSKDMPKQCSRNLSLHAGAKSTSSYRPRVVQCSWTRWLFPRELRISSWPTSSSISSIARRSTLSSLTASTSPTRYTPKLANSPKKSLSTRLRTSPTMNPNMIWAPIWPSMILFGRPSVT